MLARPAALIMAAPVFGGAFAPTHVRLGLALMLTIILLPVVPVPSVVTLAGVAVIIGREIAIGLALTLIHLISIPITNTSVNPARSTGPALFVGGMALQQLWLFWIAPIIGGALGAGVYVAVAGDHDPKLP